MVLQHAFEVAHAHTCQVGRADFGERYLAIAVDGEHACEFDGAPGLKVYFITRPEHVVVGHGLRCIGRVTAGLIKQIKAVQR